MQVDPVADLCDWQKDANGDPIIYTKKAKIPVTDPVGVNWIAFKSSYPGVTFKTQSLPQNPPVTDAAVADSWHVLMSANGPDAPVFSMMNSIPTPANFDREAFERFHNLQSEECKMRNGSVYYPEALGASPTIPSPLPRAKFTYSDADLAQPHKVEVLELARDLDAAELDALRQRLGATTAERVS